MRLEVAVIDKLEVKAERVGDLVSLGHGELVDDGPLGLEAKPVAVMPRGRRKAPDPVEVVEHRLSRYSKAPCLVASMAVSVVPNAVMFELRRVGPDERIGKELLLQFDL